MKIRVMIHACQQRMWYVEKYLIKELYRQGLGVDEVSVYLDSTGSGNIDSFLSSIDALPDTGDTWHLQDDVLLSYKFKQMIDDAEKLSGVLCGFCSFYCEDKRAGEVPMRSMWYSFPCIRIPNSLAKRFKSTVLSDEKYKYILDTGKHDDTLFRSYMLDYEDGYEVYEVHNLKPNLVDHVDFLLGGSTINSARKQAEVRALYFEDNGELNSLKNLLTSKT